MAIDLTKLKSEVETKSSLDRKEVPDRELTIQEDLASILTRVEALDKTDNTIKAIAKLKGAIELLNNNNN